MGLSISRLGLRGSSGFCECLSQKKIFRIRRFRFDRLRIIVYGVGQVSGLLSYEAQTRKPHKIVGQNLQH